LSKRETEPARGKEKALSPHTVAIGDENRQEILTILENTSGRDRDLSPAEAPTYDVRETFDKPDQGRGTDLVAFENGGNNHHLLARIMENRKRRFTRPVPIFKEQNKNG
jgi:hypothetical protein